MGEENPANSTSKDHATPFCVKMCLMHYAHQIETLNNCMCTLTFLYQNIAFRFCTLKKRYDFTKVTNGLNKTDLLL